MVKEDKTLACFVGWDEFERRFTECLPFFRRERFALVSFDFDNFNYINDLFGYEVGDEVLDRMVSHFSEYLQPGEFFARPHADHFMCLAKITGTETLVERFLKMTELRSILQDLLPEHYNLVCSGGAVFLQDQEERLSACMDRANYARKRVKGNYSSTFLCYDAKLEEEMNWRKVITLTMDQALHDREFEMFLQPKVLIKTEQIVGAEALVRWNSKKYGMIVPDRFIPIMEQNGFIKQLDFFMLEEACRFLKKSIEDGKPPLPISVNFSRAHIRTPRFVERIFHMVKGYGISTSLIEVEITENVFMDDFDLLIEVTRELKYMGFRVSLDDFGSAYSSLNYLKDLPLDIIKIDRKFLDSSTDTDRGRIIIAKIVELIKSLRLVSVMEGVETEEQVDFLRKLSCDLAQGYFYAKPMRVADYLEFIGNGSAVSDIEEYLEQERCQIQDAYHQTVPQEFEMDSWELYTLGRNIDMGLMKGYLDEEASVQYVNDKALEYIGYSRQEFRQLFNNSILAFTHPEDVKVVQENVRELMKGQPLKFQSRAIRKDGKVIILQGRASCVIDGKGRPVGIYAFQDITEEIENMMTLQGSLENKIGELERMVKKERENQEALRISEERYRLIVEQSDDIMFEWDFYSDKVTFSEKYKELLGRDALNGWLSMNADARKRIHPLDLPAFEKWIQGAFRQPRTSEGEFRLQAADGRYLWMRSRTTPILDNRGVPIKAVGVFTNIDQQKTEMDQLMAKSQRDPLTRLYNKEETKRRVERCLVEYPDQTAAFFIVDVDNFKGVNDNLGHQLGDTVLVEVAQKIRALFRDSDIVGRIGGDEIAIFAQGFDNEESLQDKGAQLVSALRNTYYGDASKYDISGSVGIACYPRDGTVFDQLYHLSDVALYESKNAGKDRYTIYRPHMVGVSKDGRTPMEWSERFLNRYFENDFTYNVFEMLYETRDMQATMQMILELTGKRFGVDRVYIFENSEDGKRISNTYEWCASHVNQEIETLQDMELSEMEAYQKAYSREGILCCSDLSVMDPYTYETLSRQGIQSFIHSAFYDGGEPIGFIGFDDCKNKREWRGDEIATIGYLSRILSVFLKKKRTRSELQESYNNYVEMLGNLNGYIYVINVDTYEILYVNKGAAACHLEVGRKCYEGAFHADSPCEKCPAAQLTEEKPFATEEIYSEILQCWINSAASRMKWKGKQNAALICCTDISRYKQAPLK